MKLLVMGNNGHLGGLSVHYKTLVSYLEKENIELFCINVNDKEEKVFNNKKVTEFVVPFQPVSILGKAKKIIRLYIAIRKAKKFMPDVFVASSLGYGFALVASKLPSSVFKIFEEVHFEATADKLRLKMLKEFDAVATQTKGMIGAFKSNVADSKPVYFLPCFSKEYDASGYKEIPSTNEGINIAYFGRLAWNKGLKEFINFTAGIFRENARIKLDIYGGGPEKESIQKEIDDQNLNAQITLKGFYSDEEFPDLITGYHAVILPSIATEGLPLILIEAMRFGRPIFTTTTGAMPEVSEINKKGMLVSEKDKTAIEANFNAFITALGANEFDATYINNVYEKNFSNKAFKDIWMKMLNDPKGYFLINQI
jgi:glycosyltransferase involved in cell wall biosynthesis